MSIYNSTHTGQEIDNFEQRIITLENNLQTLNNTLTNYINNSYNPTTLKMTYLDTCPIIRADGGSNTLAANSGAEFMTQESIKPYLWNNTDDFFIFILRHAQGLIMDNYWITEDGKLHLFLTNLHDYNVTCNNIWGYLISDPWRRRISN